MHYTRVSSKTLLLVSSIVISRDEGASDDSRVKRSADGDTVPKTSKQNLAAIQDAMQPFKDLCRLSQDAKDKDSSSPEQRREDTKACKTALRVAVTAERKEDDPVHPMSVWIQNYLEKNGKRDYATCKEKYNSENEETKAVE